MEKIKELNEQSVEFVKNNLYSGVICDILDDLGLPKQVMDQAIRPIMKHFKVFGKALTILGADFYEISEKPYELELRAVDKLGPLDISVASTSSSVKSGFWGELLSTVATVNKSKGAIIDTFTRDAEKIIKMDFNLFCKGFCPYDSKGRTRVIDYNCRIECAGVQVNPGDLIFGDIDGIVVIPAKIGMEVINKAYEKVRAENMVRKKLLNGMPATDAYDKYGIL